jgi:anti-sigma-K factor RskA
MSHDDPREVYDGCGEDAAPYVLGALTDAEHKAFRVHLGSCAICREEVASLEVVAHSLPAAVPQLSAPGEVRDRVMATVKAEAELRQERTPRVRSRRLGPKRTAWRLGLASAVTTSAAVIAIVLALGGSGGSHASQHTQLIRAQVSAPRGTATLAVSAGHGQLRIAGLPQSPPRHVYEVWLERAGKAHPTDALFTVSVAGNATVAVPGSLAGVKAVMVTAEPEGGSTVPTSKPVIVAGVS